jgi:CRP/FNR family cyclic AMP-dependent transcriptional regulator
MTMLDTLRNSLIFKGFSTEHLEKVSALCRGGSYPEGTLICKEGEEAKEFYILTEGRVTLEMKVQPVPERPAIPTAVEIVEAGGSFGWSALVEPYRYTLSVRCATKCTVLALKSEVLRKLMADDTALGFELMKRVAQLISLRLLHTRLRLTSGLGLIMLGKEMGTSG